jgi:hypothetical protein
MSVGTPPEGIRANIITIESWASLEEKGKAGLVKGRVVFFNCVFTKYGNNSPSFV